MYSITASEEKIMKDLVKELNEFNSYVRSGVRPPAPAPGSYFYAFNPSGSTDRTLYKRNIRLLATINDVLDENCINIKSQAYTYIRDAICLITDKKSLDVCMVTDIYPYIAEKHRSKSQSGVAHCIRNAVDSAYKTVRSRYPERNCIMNSFDDKPTSKRFLLRAVQEVSRRLLEELSA